MVQLKYHEIMAELRQMQKTRVFYIPKAYFTHVRDLRLRESEASQDEDEEEEASGDPSNAQDQSNKASQMSSTRTNRARRAESQILSPTYLDFAASLSSSRAQQRFSLDPQLYQRASVRLKNRRSRKLQSWRKHVFRITYKDSLIPDEIYKSREYKRVKIKSFLDNIEGAVIDFYRRSKMVKKDDMVQLIAAWLSTIKEFGTFSDPFRLSLVNSFTLAHASDKYLFNQGDKLDKIYLLVSGVLRVSVNHEKHPLMKPVCLVNNQLVYAIGPVPMSKSVFALGKCDFLVLPLFDFLEMKRFYHANDQPEGILRNSLGP